jgi:S-disulfanyl-L-cysteine oxidoreductase SoxD
MKRQDRAGAVAALCCAALAVGAGCRMESRPQPTSSQVATALPERFGLGRPATPTEIAAWDIDVDTAGHGLPAGRGDALRGAAIYRDKCATCHGAKGEGIAPQPALIGPQPRDSFPFARDASLVHTIGNYWPYATTLFDYVRRTMPLSAPGSLSNEDVYSVTAYLLVANEVLPPGSTLDSASLVAVRMPARNRFVPDNRRGGPEVR